MQGARAGAEESPLLPKTLWSFELAGYQFTQL